MADKTQEEFEAWFAETYPLGNLERDTEEVLRKMIANQAWIASRAKPVPKVCECGPLRNVTDGGHFPACTRCILRLA